MSEAEHATLAELWLREDELLRSGSIMQLWQWLLHHAQSDAERASFAGCCPSMSGRDGQTDDVRDPVTEWLPLIACSLDQQPRVSSRGRHTAAPGTLQAPIDDAPHKTPCRGKRDAPTLVLAVLRGLLLDLLTTNEYARVQQAFELFATLLEAITELPDP